MGGPLTETRILKKKNAGSGSTEDQPGENLDVQKSPPSLSGIMDKSIC